MPGGITEDKMSFHRTHILGNLGADPQVHYTTDGQARAMLRVAVNDRWKTSDGQLKEHTEWYRLVCFGRLAETCGEYLHKGNRIFVEGRMRTRSWQDDSGQQQYITELHADSIEFLDGRTMQGLQGQQAAATLPERDDAVLEP
jgi:single-strand DNA-binding protein